MNGVTPQCEKVWVKLQKFQGDWDKAFRKWDRLDEGSSTDIRSEEAFANWSQAFRAEMDRARYNMELTWKDGQKHKCFSKFEEGKSTEDDAKTKKLYESVKSHISAPSMELQKEESFMQWGRSSK